MVNRCFIQFHAYGQVHELYSKEPITQEQIDAIFFICETAIVIDYSKNRRQKKFVDEKLSVTNHIDSLIDFHNKIKSYE